MSFDTQAGQGRLAAVLERTIRDIDIPPRPTIIDRICHEMRKDMPNFTLIGQQIGADVSLAAGLIKTVNSPYFGCRSRCRSVQEALLMLGLDASSRAIAAISLRQAFPGSAHYERFWQASAQIAALSGWLAQTVRKSGLRADDAYTYGLFRDCGIVILLRRFPDYMKMLDRANHEAERSFTDIEEDLLPTNHSLVGCLLAQNWWLPEEICLAIRYHHDRDVIDHFDSGLPGASRYLVAASQTAEHILQYVTGGSHTEEWQKLGPSCLRLLNLDEGKLTELYDEGAALIKRNE
ncbi:HDOD domain-containing protein [Candidatus Accumulibacter phosphatis]|jgi:HD-like signal output (HDOD) protein|uniref:HDOD domain-containing protein n=1 Tax=Candidatus Accumulibacter phosphatis TaxID=327160 RepID=A0ABX1U2Z3_9PROT|nr:MULTISPECIES: HDOD domain-containing protein [Candidatus Accumulibacter]NMQ29557.1 HDOD domain-containing protein [Candidatus Accumulibacter phosphatis]